MKMPEFADLLGARAGVPARDAQKLIRAFYEVLGEGLEKEDSMHLPGFGRAVARTSQNGRRNIVLIPRQKPADQESDG